MKIIFQVLAVIALLFSYQVINAQNDIPEEMQIELRPLVDITTGLDDSSYSKIEEAVVKSLDAQIRISKFSSFPHLLVTQCTAEHEIGLGGSTQYGTQIHFKFSIVDLVGKQSFGDLEIDVSGKGKSKEEAIDVALKLFKKENAEKLNSFIIDAYMGILKCYESNCEEKLIELREPSSMAMPEDRIVNFISFPAVNMQCKEKANEELVMMFSDYCMNKCEEFNSMLEAAITNKDKEVAELYFTKMSYLFGCEEQLELKKEKLVKMKIPVDQILTKSEKIRFIPMEADRMKLHKKVAEVLLLVMNEDMSNDPGMLMMKIEEVKRIIEEQ